MQHLIDWNTYLMQDWLLEKVFNVIVIWLVYLRTMPEISPFNGQCVSAERIRPAEPGQAVMVWWWYDGIMVRWYNGTMVRWYDGTMVWWYNGMMVRWYNGIMVRWYNGMMVWWYDGMMVWWYDGMMAWWYGGMVMVWWHDGMVVWWRCMMQCMMAWHWHG